MILALRDDTSTLLSTLVARELSEDVRIVARTDESESVGKMYRAGADYVIALATVSGRMTASAVLEEEIIAPSAQLEIVKTGAPGLAGETLAEADVRARTGSTIVAVEREGSVLTALGPDFVFESDDEVIVAGTDETVNAFTELVH